MVLCAGAVAQQPSVRRVALLGGGKQVELEIAVSQPATPVARVVAGPDRVVFDFANFVPAKELRNLAVRRAGVKGVRVGLFSSNPPVTRVVVDLAAPIDFEMFPSGKSVIVKFAAAAAPAAGKIRSRTAPALIATSQPIRSRVEAVVVEPKVIVGYADGKLMVKADRASLAEILNEVRRQTGANISMPPAASQEQVVGSFGPAAPRDVLSSILNGSQFNFIILGAENDASRLQSVTLTARGEGESQPAIYNPVVVENPVATSANQAPQQQPEGIEPQSNAAASQQPEMPVMNESPPPQAQSDQDIPQPEPQPQ